MLPLLPAVKGLIGICLLGLLPVTLCAQQAQDSLILHKGDTLQLRGRNLIPFEEVVRSGDTTLKPGQLGIDYLRGLVWIKDPQLPSELKLSIRYRCFAGKAPAGEYVLRLPPKPPRLPTQKPDSMTGSYKLHIDTARLVSYHQQRQATDPLTPHSNLQRSGSLSRALTFGTNRDLGVSSDFRLNLNGTVGQDIEIAASMTDNNLPLQPSGTTQQITDFDKIFIQVKRNHQAVTFGDLELQQRNTAFANIYRDVLGMQVGNAGSKSSWSFTGASSKGSFHTNAFQGENGKQGPYRLVGKQNEQFIIVLAGSERVYINGRMLARGEDRDYVIEYNTGELTFTPRMVVDVNSRIVVDFEYSVRTYARSLVFGTYHTEQAAGKLKLRMSYGREADDPQAPINLVLTDSMQKALAAAGRGVIAANLPGADSVGYSTNEPRYIKLDTLVAGVIYPGIYVHATDANRAVYRLTFSYVGAGMGDYLRQASLINGNIFAWTAPNADGTHRGDYAPLRITPLPQLLQVVDVGAEMNIAHGLVLTTEGAYSSLDRNRYATTGKPATGLASRTTLKLQRTPLLPGLAVQSEVNYQYVDADYTNFDRVYQMEYGRIWNFNDKAPRGVEHVVEAVNELSLQNNYRLRTTLGLRHMADSITTHRYLVELESKDTLTLLGKYSFNAIVTNNTTAGTVSSWLRQNGDFYKLLAPTRSKLRLGSELWIESKRLSQGENMLAGSFQFADFKPYLRNSPAGKLQYDLNFEYRYDRQFWLGHMRNKSLTYKPSLTLAYRPSPKFRLENTSTYFLYNLLDTSFTQQGLTNQRTFQTNLRTIAASKDQRFQNTLFYEIASERLARRELVYVQVNPGAGQYDWIDYNHDGIQELNEFELSANPLLANYIRVLAPTQQLYPVTRVALGGTVKWDLSKLVGEGGGGFKNFARNISFFSNFRVEQKRNFLAEGLSNYYISWKGIMKSDTNTLNALINFRQDVYFYRNNTHGDVSVTYNFSQNKQFLNSGLEIRSLNSISTRQRFNLDKVRSLDNTLQLGEKQSFAQLFPTRNYQIKFFSTNPAVNFQLNRKLRLTGGYEFKLKRNLGLAEDQAKLTVHKAILDAKINFKAKDNLLVKLELVHNELTGTPPSSASYELLEGLQPGQNVVWNLLATHYLTSMLELSVIYDGRAAHSFPLIQSTRVQVKALF